MSDCNVPAMKALTVIQREMLLELISDELARVKPIARQRFNELVQLMLDIRGEP